MNFLMLLLFASSYPYFSDGIDKSLQSIAMSRVLVTPVQRVLMPAGFQNNLTFVVLCLLKFIYSPARREALRSTMTMSTSDSQVEAFNKLAHALRAASIMDLEHMLAP